MTTPSPLSAFHPLIQSWFTREIGTPTPAQTLAWPRIAAGEHVLVTAPTGSGKTLAAFLWAIDRLAQGAWETGRVRVLYISPLRALNNDIRRNLDEPLAALAGVFRQAGASWPGIRAATRSGDTPQSARRRTLRQPPEILITTPESLNILLTTASGCALLEGVQSLILDEVHAVAGSKRGTHLITAVERLARLAGEFQRIALSATVRPPELVAGWVGGQQVRRRAGGTVHHTPRPVAVLDAGGRKAYDLRVSYTTGEDETARAEEETFWESLAGEVAEHVAGNNSTLIFANSRRKVEKVARLVNLRPAADARVYAHHGSLSRELREEVETRLKAGELDGIVSTNSLELGIDVGAIDEVVLVQTPPSVTATVQRVGRAGHQVGATSKGRLIVTHPRDLLDAAVVVRSVLAGEVEPLHLPAGSLDVLAQVLLSMTAVETWEVDELYATVCASAPYRDLPRGQFDLVLEMLAGRYAGTRLPALKPRVALDRVSNTVRARPGVARLLFAAGGTIPDRGYFGLRHAESHAKIGELDEEFVWERTIGETFLLGVQAWKVQRITHQDVLVTPGRGGAAMAPFWRADKLDHGWFLAGRVGEFLEQADARLDDGWPAFKAELEAEHRLDGPTAERLKEFLVAQRRATGCALPHRRHVVVEQVTDPQGRGGESQLLLLHTRWGGRVNRPFGLALAAAYEERHGVSLKVSHDDDCLVLELPAASRADEILSLVGPDDVEQLLRRGLETTGFFGARFRENAGRALLLPRAGFGKRTPLWRNRERAKNLLQAVQDREDFPILLETWRTCLQDEMELEALRARLAELEAGEIAVSEVRTSRPSPFAAEVFWQRTNDLMYEDDTPAGGPSKLRGDLIQEVVRSAALRPSVDPEVVELLRQKLQRTAPGYAPREPDELIEWVKERLLIPAGEWDELLLAAARDGGLERAELLAGVAARVVALPGVGEAPALVCSVEAVARLRAVLGRGAELAAAALDGTAASVEAQAAVDTLAARGEPAPAGTDAGDDPEPLATLLAEWLRFRAVTPVAAVVAALGTEPEAVAVALQALAADDQVVLGELTAGASEPEVCDTENLARLLRLVRAAARPTFETLPAEALPLILARHQGLGATPAGDDEDLVERLEHLLGFPAAAGEWEGEILPTRLPAYQPGWLDRLLAESELEWFGCGEGRVAFTLAGDRDLFPGDADEEAPAALAELFPEETARYTLGDLAARTGRQTGALAGELWALAFQGRITCDTFAPVRQGAAHGFAAAPVAAPTETRTGGRGAFASGSGLASARLARWKSSRPFPGAWVRRPQPEPPEDLLGRDELDRERARVLVARYGVVFRELLARELPALRWGAVFRALRLLELGGEVIGGRFVEGPAGVQFIAPALLRKLREGLPEERVFWVAARDPASPCGLGVEGLDLPARRRGTHLVYRGTTLVLVSEAQGKRLTINVPADDERLPAYLEFLAVRIERSFTAGKGVVVETINGEAATGSAYRDALAVRFEVSADHRTLRLSRRY